MTRPRLLDLFCGAGGATRGYQLAGFHVTGVDHRPQPNYCGDEFHQADAMTFSPNELNGFDAIHASPPCQAFTAYNRKPGNVRPGHPDLVGATRRRLARAGVPYVIENVPGAPLHNPIMLCGSSFGLDIRRHRLFEPSALIMALPCDHSWQTPRFPHAGNRDNPRSTVEIGVWRIPLDVQQRAMGIDWMTREELSQAIPPVYTEHIGAQLLEHVRAGAAA